MKPATNVHPAAGQGKGFVRTQNQPLWSASSPRHSSSCQLSSSSAKTACPGSMRPCSTATRLPVWTEPLSGTLGEGSGSLPAAAVGPGVGRASARPPGSFCACASRRSSSGPPTECLEQLLLELSRQRDLHTARGLDRPPHLLEVVPAANTGSEMPLEALPILGRQAVFEVRRDQFHDLLTCEFPLHRHLT